MSKQAFKTCLKTANHHGIIVGVSLPTNDEYALDEALRQLHKEEALYSKQLKGKRLISWLGGRIASRQAASIIGAKLGPIMSDPFGAPICDNKFYSLSISHKSSIAIAIISKVNNANIGIDIEDLTDSRLGIAPKVLTQFEMEDHNKIPRSRQWTSLLQRFSTKESIYKALAPRHRRRIRFDEAEVFPSPDGQCQIELKLNRGPFPDSLQARYMWHENYLITTVYAKWATIKDNQNAR